MKTELLRKSRKRILPTRSDSLCGISIWVIEYKTRGRVNQLLTNKENEIKYLVRKATLEIAHNFMRPT